jgi:hypothetical protein
VQVLGFFWVFVRPSPAPSFAVFANGVREDQEGQIVSHQQTAKNGVVLIKNRRNNAKSEEQKEHGRGQGGLYFQRGGTPVPAYPGNLSTRDTREKISFLGVPSCSHAPSYRGRGEKFFIFSHPYSFACSSAASMICCSRGTMLDGSGCSPSTSRALS